MLRSFGETQVFPLYMQQKQCKPTMFKQDFNEEDHNSRYFWYIAGVFFNRVSGYRAATLD